MKPHESFYGTTCFFCGHPRTDNRSRTVAKVKYGACKDCAQVKVDGGTAAEVKAALWRLRSMDLAEIAAALVRGSAKSAVYWTPADFRGLLTTASKHGAGVLKALAPKEYSDAFAGETQARQEERMREYKRNYRKDHKDKEPEHEQPK